MKIKKFISALLAAATLATVTAYAADNDELFEKTYVATDLTYSAENGIVTEDTVPEGDYTVTIKTGGEAASDANIFINGGERVRAYKLVAGETKENVQSVIPLDGKITIQIKGENPDVTEIKIQQLADRTEAGEKPTIYIAGDSTAQTYNYTKVFPQTGWGQVFSEQFNDDIIIENRAMAGRSSKSYDNDGRLDKILTELKPGDYVFIQFGINDGSSKPERYISVEDYKTLIVDKYIGETVKHGGIPVLMTPSSAAWWDEENGCFKESRTDYADPTREIAEETGVKFIDINRIMTDTWNSMDKQDVLDGYFICEQLESKAYQSGTNDTTHLKAKGARKVAELVADAIPESVPELAKYLKTEETFTDIDSHWGKVYIAALKKNGMANGDGTGKFNPDDTVTRAEFLKMSMDACGIVPHAYRDGECLDASNDDWYCYYLQGALDKDLIPEVMIDGCKVETVTKTLSEATEEKEAVTAEVNVYTGKFDGGEVIRREEAAAVVMACAAYKYRSVSDWGNAAGESFKDDDEIDEAYRSMVKRASGLGYISGMGDGTFAPKGTLTRAQAAAITARVAGILKTAQAF